MDEESEYGLYEDDLESWETEQVFQDAMAEREELYEEGVYSDDARRFGDDFGPFGGSDEDTVEPDFE